MPGQIRSHNTMLLSGTASTSRSYMDKNDQDSRTSLILEFFRDNDVEDVYTLRVLSSNDAKNENGWNEVARKLDAIFSYPEIFNVFLGSGFNDVWVSPSGTEDASLSRVTS
ncbi:hypothetical protein THOM_2922 [Trachipleistophora hominis]|uniref:Uncharacterized protein n=1 Tax=Trachipleistophora hominis TaxID=72359 RepID=L7JRP2_TRAHO|nr:hypothetical protein THOM_2922 [Trachipleistophora hominis]